MLADMVDEHSPINADVVDEPSPKITDLVDKVEDFPTRTHAQGRVTNSRTHFKLNWSRRRIFFIVLSTFL